MKEIDVPSSDREKVKVNLVGKHYVVTVPKASVALRLARKVSMLAKAGKKNVDADLKVLDDLDAWLSKSFGATQFKDVKKRLNDDDDDLDYPHLMVMLERLIEIAASPEEDEEETPSTS